MRLPAIVQQLARPLPLGPVELMANAAFHRVLHRHVRLFERLGEHGSRTFAFVPVDLPFAFVVVPVRRRIAVLRPDRLPRTDVRIGGAIATLLALAEGRLDGDAEFFARGVSVDGDMEAALALRNAMDDCRIDLATDLAPDGPLRRPVEALLQTLRSAALSGAVR
ncbi:MAG: SCP2 sterol-binding domain-containing protein [Devosia sp.]|nr:SCP2 sterol-binding domain-containing protein [Devosia sp.]